MEAQMYVWAPQVAKNADKRYVPGPVTHLCYGKPKPPRDALAPCGVRVDVPVLNDGLVYKLAEEKKHG